MGSPLQYIMVIGRLLPAFLSADLHISISFRTFAAKNTTDHNETTPPC